MVTRLCFTEPENSPKSKREKNRYRITDKGRREFKSWMEAVNEKQARLYSEWSTEQLEEYRD
jgi:DNA-binding PadR family transcriptional regulator